MQKCYTLFIKMSGRTKMQTNMMNCIHCNQQIPAARLKALPGTKTCIACSATGRVAGFPLIQAKLLIVSFRLWIKIPLKNYMPNKNARDQNQEKE
jgi:hypothetical protein